jgi:hypothetical protein
LWAAHRQFKIFVDCDDRWGMEPRVQFFVLVLVVSLLSCCTIIDELDAANAKMPSSGAAESTAPGAAAPPEPNALVERSKEWWRRATSLAPNEMDASIVNCRIGQSAQFMSKDDCLSRGGVPQSKS